MKGKVACLLSLSALSLVALVSPAHANPEGDRPTNGPAILAQRSERAAQNPDARYFGQRIAGGNYIGFAGSNEGAALNGKYALSNRFSVRPGVIAAVNEDDNGERDIAVLAPITYDFNSANGGKLQPFVGAGAGVTTGDETELQFVATAGADYQLGRRYAINGSVNYLPFDDQSVDFVAGLGYRC